MALRPIDPRIIEHTRSGGVARRLNTVLDEQVSVTQFAGADPTGVSASDAAFTAAIAAAGSGQQIVVPYGEFKLDTDIDASNRVFIIYGRFTGSGSLTGNEVTFYRADGVMRSTGSPFGAGFLAQHHFHTRMEDTHAGADFGDTRSVFAATMKARGSGWIDPSKADVTAFISVEKEDYLTSTVRGEVDALYIVARQGRRDDQGGILVDHRKVRTGTTSGPDADTGGSVGIECAGEWITPTEGALPTLRIQTVFNFLEGRGAWSDGTGYGVWAEAQAGEPAAAFFGCNGTYYVNGTPAATGGFSNLIVGAASRNAGSEYYKVDGNGRTYGASGDAITPGYSFIGDTNTGICRPFADYLTFTTNGVGKLVITDNGPVLPGTNGTQSLGNASYLWSAVWSSTGSIQTSDRNAKRDFRDLTDAEINAAVKIAKAIKVYRLREAVEAKGDAAREHVGSVAQEVHDIMAEHGLDAWNYGFMCKDTWDDQYKFTDPVYGEEETGVLDVRGRPVTRRVVVEPARAVLVTPAGEKWSLRYDELSQFCIAGVTAHFERRLAALEAAGE